MKKKSKVRKVSRMGAQGDVLFRRVDAIPDGYERQENKGPIVVAHSETGHHHTVPGLEATLFAKRGDNMVSYLQMSDVKCLEVTHHRPYDTHETMGLLGGSGAVWEVRRQRESAPEGWRQVAD